MDAKLILAVDDSEPTLILLHQVLLHLGFRVVLANNGREAVQQAARHRPDLILLDLQMPGEDARETMRALAWEGWAAATPVLGLAERPEDEELAAETFAGVVRKPIVMPALVRALEKCLGRIPPRAGRYAPSAEVADPPLA
jgi:CheY-like chemotaxis protein